jgi:hypothetical protein
MTVNINLNKLKDFGSEMCNFRHDRLALLDDNGNILNNKYTIIGKYYTGKQKLIEYITCDGIGRKTNINKNKIIALGEDKFTNITISKNGQIRFIHGSIPFIVKEEKIKNRDTVVKLGNISQGTIGSIGVGTKFLGKRLKDDKIGCVKLELFPKSLDINNEIVAYELGKLLGFDVAEASFEIYKARRCIISIYGDEALKGNIKTLKSEIGTDNFHSKFNRNWVVENKSTRAWYKYVQMIMLDLIMHQTDRHISNIAFTDNDLYSLYDNGRSLFFDEDIEDVNNKINLKSRGSIVESFITNEHGYGWVYLEDVLGYNNYEYLIRHDLTYEQFFNIVDDAYRLGNASVDMAKMSIRIAWLSEYMYRVYLIIIRQENRKF